jgi:hypothetical protein
MQADRVAVAWNDAKGKWEVRIEAGAEVIRRYCDLPRQVDEAKLRASAEKTITDEGYAPTTELSIAR